MSHAPMRSAGRKKRPEASVTRSTDVPLARWVAVTVAPGSTPPELSRTMPPISPVFICANDTADARQMPVTAADSRRAHVTAPDGLLDPNLPPN